ncbi:conjugative transposon protein TraM [uncultured Pedobacter sp.]|uniref:conjugative transposon protein TraM n=1 Tax=uncultured Pedobacter sp. TaxID=246139 RepID=UPI00261CC75B|nr:conjugative transposon protein TraM [uncultured Pedobacter sp.]
MVQKDQKNERKRKVLLMFPVLLFPFVTLLFWALGGGTDAKADAMADRKGMNVELPVANNKELPQDKMSFYTEAEKSEQELEKQQKSDPYFEMQFDSSHLGGESKLNAFNSNPTYQATGPDERQVYQKLNALQQAIDQEQQQAVQPQPRYRNQEISGGGEDLKRLEEMMERMNASSQETDPEMKQVSDVLESILDLQHPERVRQKIKKQSELNRGSVYPVTLPPENDPVGSLVGQQNNERSNSVYNGFYGLETDNEKYGFSNQLTIRAVVHETQTLVNGSTVKLRLVDPVYINGTYLPKDLLVFGTANLNGERLTINITHIRSENMLFPVELNVFDLDGMEGIYIPGAITRDVAKQSGDRSLQGISMNTFDPSFGAQAASAGIELTKNLFSRKIKLIKVQVKAGYQVMLVDENNEKR